MWITENSNFPEDFFTEGFLPHFNTSLTDLLEPIITPVVPIFSSLVGGTFPSL